MRTEMPFILHRTHEVVLVAAKWFLEEHKNSCGVLTVSGPIGDGKSAVLLAIAKHAKELGIKTQYIPLCPKPPALDKDADLLIIDDATLLMAQAIDVDAMVTQALAQNINVIVAGEEIGRYCEDESRIGENKSIALWISPTTLTERSTHKKLYAEYYELTPSEVEAIDIADAKCLRHVEGAVLKFAAKKLLREGGIAV